MTEEFPSKLLEHAVAAVSDLPGIGKRTALRLVLHLLRQDVEATDRLTEALHAFRHNVRFCDTCHNLSDQERCDICANPHRLRHQICVVEQVQDVMAIEHTAQFNGVYHVLGGLISPIDGVGPSDLQIASLVERVRKGDVEEIILALSPTMEGDTTGYYIARQLADVGVRITTIARGVSVGDELQYADEVTLGRSIVNRIDYKV